MVARAVPLVWACRSREESLNGPFMGQIWMRIRTSATQRHFGLSGLATTEALWLTYLMEQLIPEDERRFARHLALPEIGTRGQLRLAQSRVLVIGAGGLGSPASVYLAAAGVGTLGLVDSDTVELSNLHRQILHATPDIGRPKVRSAKDRLEQIYPRLNLETYQARLDEELAVRLVPRYDLVLDGSDNFPTRDLLNRVCVQFRRPLIYGSVSRFLGQCSVFAAENGPCYRCLYPTNPPPGAMPNCSESGVLGVLPGFIGTLQAAEAIKIITRIGRPLVGRLLTWNALEAQFSTFAVAPDPDCRICGQNRTKGEPPRMNPKTLSPAEFKRRKESGEPLELIDVREPFELAIANMGGVHIPLGQLPNRLNELNPETSYVVVCHHGMRSAHAAQFLCENGFRSVYNLAGGIDRWSVEIEPTIPRY